MSITVGSLFDGIGGTLLSAKLCGATPLWASEIEKFPIQVTEHHFPEVIHLGDITKIKGAEIPAVDIIVGGSPCQDLSVAGKRKGMKHGELGDEETTRSGLFIEQIRIVKEMRHATDGKSARFMVWENVPGAFSSNQGEDFRVVLEETARIVEAGVVIPQPPKGKWKNAGSIMGDGWSIAWRVFDAQHWGVPQRRRRIYLVADFRGQSAPEILFERESVFWDSSESQNEGQGIAGDAESGIRSAGFNGWKSVSGNPACNQGGMIVFENHANDSRVTGPLDVVPTATKRWGTGGGNVPFVMKTQESSYWDGGQVVGTLSTRNANGAQRMPDKQHFNCVIQTYANQRSDEYIQPAVSSTMSARDYKSATNLAVQKAVRRLTPLECERLQGYPDGWTDIPGASDSARYKALGNSFAVPNIYNVLKGCVEVLSND